MRWIIEPKEGSASVTIRDELKVNCVLVRILSQLNKLGFRVKEVE